jgi:putative phosphoesterase
MKLALLGDIHGNDLALEAVLTAAHVQKADELLVTGDLVGYYFAPRKVIELLSSWKRYVVRGNHEDMLEKARKYPYLLGDIDKKYGCGLRIALDDLTVGQLDYLCSLSHPLVINVGQRKILLCHGAPEDLNQYVYPDDNLGFLESPNFYSFDLIVLGHTHYPMKRKLPNGSCIVNPGSVGQPRNRIPGAHWALYDTDTDEVEFFCESYDYKSVSDEAIRIHPELPYLSTVLLRT